MLLGTLSYVSYASAAQKCTYPTRGDAGRASYVLLSGNLRKELEHTAFASAHKKTGRIGQSVPREAFHRSSSFSKRLTDYFEFLLYAAPIALRCWKHSRQNTGRPCVGRKGTVVSFPH